jgi:hypothetical protein
VLRGVSRSGIMFKPAKFAFAGRGKTPSEIAQLSLRDVGIPVEAVAQ